MICVSKANIELTSKIVGNENLTNCLSKLAKHEDYNCWGFTAFTLQLINKLCWVDRLDMDEILKKHTRLIHREDRKKGDIVVYRVPRYNNERNYLFHTAILINAEHDTIIHKDGEEPLDIDNVFKLNYCNNHKNLQITYRRLKNNGI